MGEGCSFNAVVSHAITANCFDRLDIFDMLWESGSVDKIKKCHPDVHYEGQYLDLCNFMGEGTMRNYSI